MKRLGLLLVVLLVAVTFMAGAQAKPALKLLAISRINPNPTWAPTDTTLQKLVAAAANAYVGRTVTVEWGNYPPDTTRIQFLQMREAAGNMPEILLLDDLMWNAEGYEYAIKRGLVKEITTSDLNTNMKAYVARFKTYGTDLSYAIGENVKTTGDAGKGKLWFVPLQFNPAPFPSSKVPNGFAKPSPNGALRGGMFRDDILKKVVPTAKTEAEFRQLMVAKKGKLTAEDMVDFSMSGFGDLYSYLKKVQALNLKVGERMVIPAALSGDSERATSWQGHQPTAMGYLYHGEYWWQDAPLYLKSVDLAPETREQARWYNKMYNEGLLDPEMFIMKNDQFYAKVANGEYAVIPWYWVPTGSAAQVGRTRNYGWRVIPFFYPFDMSRTNNKYSRVSFGSGGVFMTSKIKAADYGDVLKYLDYFMTEKSDDLAYWGSPAWSTGTGVDRKFKPEYKDLENWAVYGKEGGKDGTYYGLGGAATINMADGAHYQFQVKPFAFFQVSGFTYPWAPHYSYRANMGWDPQAELAKVDMLSWVNDWWYSGYVGSNTVYYRINKGPDGNLWDWWGYQWGSPEFAAFSANLDSTTVRGLVARALTGAEGDFDDNWDILMNYEKDAGLEKAEAAARATLKANWDANILKSIVK